MCDCENLLLRSADGESGTEDGSSSEEDTDESQTENTPLHDLDHRGQTYLNEIRRPHKPDVKVTKMAVRVRVDAFAINPAKQTFKVDITVWLFTAQAMEGKAEKSEHEEFFQAFSSAEGSHSHWIEGQNLVAAAHVDLARAKPGVYEEDGHIGLVWRQGAKSSEKNQRIMRQSDPEGSVRSST